MFYEDQHKLAAYLERTGAEWEVKIAVGGYGPPAPQYSTKYYTKYGVCIRPVLRYGLPSHLLYQSHNPDGLTEDQICEGGKYRCAIASENDGRFGTFKFNQCQVWDKDSSSWKPTLTEMLAGKTIRLPSTVPWPDWEQEAAQPDPKDARIAELEKQAEKSTTTYKALLKACHELIAELEAKVSGSPWRRMSEVPTEEECDKLGYVIGLHEEVGIMLLRVKDHTWPKGYAGLLAWMPVPKFHGWPDPLADLLKEHGVEVTPEILAALNAWKGVEK